VAEDPRLHLVGVYDRVFVKPLPKYLLSYDFWQIYLLNNASQIKGKTAEEIQSSKIHAELPWAFCGRTSSSLRTSQTLRLLAVKNTS
jgi:hypothetical protein